MGVDGRKATASISSAHRHDAPRTGGGGNGNTPPGGGSGNGGNQPPDHLLAFIARHPSKSFAAERGDLRRTFDKWNRLSRDTQYNNPDSILATAHNLATRRDYWVDIGAPHERPKVMPDGTLQFYKSGLAHIYEGKREQFEKIFRNESNDPLTDEMAHDMIIVRLTEVLKHGELVGRTESRPGEFFEIYSFESARYGVAVGANGFVVTFFKKK